ncbi:MAG: hypothetical protein ACRC80_26665 [Waterburya sp.]
MNLQTARQLQTMCEKLNAIGVEVWYVGLRFHLKDGKLSKVFSRKGLDLEIGQVWVNSINHDKNSIKILKKVHPDRAKDKQWSTKVSQSVIYWREVIQGREITRILFTDSFLTFDESSVEEHLLASLSSGDDEPTDYFWGQEVRRSEPPTDELLKWSEEMRGF